MTPGPAPIEEWGTCPVCHARFMRSSHEGRRQMYCSGPCAQRRWAAVGKVFGRLEPSDVTWMQDAECRRGHDPEMWFVDVGHGNNGKRERAAAIAICNQCPVLADCLVLACRLRVAGPLHGIWAGRPAAWFTPTQARATLTAVGGKP